MYRESEPNWLKRIQNRSWEPEILISGITLTFVFILSNHVYNFFGMLVQDYAVNPVIADILFIISILTITSSKIVLIVHLILRGFWTGLVGLSYVFPKGVKKRNLQKSQRHVEFDKPAEHVIKLERICSLLFSFIFSSFTFFYGIILTFLPMVFLYFLGIDLAYIRILMFSFSAALVAVPLIVFLFFRKKYQQSELKKKFEKSTINLLLPIYFSNLGSKKIYAAYIIFFLFIIFAAKSEMAKFDFDHRKSAVHHSDSELVSLNKDHYADSRSIELRTPKSFINKFRIEENKLELFISFYKEDLYTLKKIEQFPEAGKEFFLEYDSTGCVLPDIYQISLDDSIVSGLKWYSMALKHTNQKGMFSEIPLNNYFPGYHELKIDKLYWKISKEKLLLIEDWDIIPFEIESG